MRVEQVREAGVRHGCHGDPGPSKSAKHPSPAGMERGRKRQHSGKGPSGEGGGGGEGSDNGGAKSGDLQGARRLVGSLFQRRLPLENVSPSLTVAEKLRRRGKLTRGDERPASTANINRDIESR